MADLFEASSILYFLILPIVIGMGIDSRYKHRYPVGMLFGLIFYLVCCSWGTFGQTSSLTEVEPIIILIVLGLSILVIGIIFERKGDTSVFQRNALVFLTVSVAGLPLYAIKYFVEGKAPVGYPESLLPLFQFTLALIALVVLANIFEKRIYAKNEEIIEDKYLLREDEELEMDYETMEESDIGESLYASKRTDARLVNTDLEDLELDYWLDEF